MASKIDSSEGSVMAELEGMESKRLEAATDYAGKLEDKYGSLSKIFKTVPLSACLDAIEPFLN